MFSFDGECVYEDLQCLRNKTNMPEEKQIRISSNLSYRVNNKTKYDALEKRRSIAYFVSRTTTTTYMICARI